MKNFDALSDTISKYLKGQLTRVEPDAFTKQMKADPDFFQPNSQDRIW